MQKCDGEIEASFAYHVKKDTFYDMMEKCAYKIINGTCWGSIHSVIKYLVLRNAVLRRILQGATWVAIFHQGGEPEPAEITCEVCMRAVS